MPWNSILTANGTFEGWFQPTTQDPNTYRTVCSSMYNSNFSTALTGWLIYQHPASAFTLVTFNGTGAPATFISDFANIPLNIGSWYHLVLVDNGSTIQLYVNGVAGSASGSATLFVPNGINGDPSLSAQPSVLAQRSDGAFFGFNGGVDEVAFYNYPLSLTSDQIALRWQNVAELHASRREDHPDVARGKSAWLGQGHRAFPADQRRNFALHGAGQRHPILLRRGRAEIGAAPFRLVDRGGRRPGRKLWQETGAPLEPGCCPRPKIN